MAAGTCRWSGIPCLIKPFVNKSNRKKVLRIPRREKPFRPIVINVCHLCAVTITDIFQIIGKIYKTIFLTL